MRGSAGSAPAITRRAAAASPTVQVSGPKWSNVGESVVAPCPETRPYVGFSPTAPQWNAGPRVDPLVSEPTVTRTSPAATAAPEPDDEPLGTCSSLHGFLAGGTGRS